MASKEGNENTVSIGIDLGTTNTCVAVIKNGNVKIVQNCYGRRTIPSVVCFTKDKVLVGEAAKDRMHKYPTSTAYDVKRLLGCTYDELVTYDDLNSFSFKIVRNGNNPNILIEKEGEEELFYPEEISAFVLQEAIKNAEEYLGCKVDNAVITVPAYFNQAQRQATYTSAKIAGIEVLKIINEPSAAAIAYGFENKSDVPRTVLVYDLGGGTFDVSIVSVVGNKYKVKATTGDTRLGGRDFENRLVSFLVKYIETNYDENLRDNREAMSRLRHYCNQKKERLSFEENVEIELLGLLSNHNNLELNIPQERFVDLNQDLFEKTIDIVELCLYDSRLTKEDIDEIVLVGGSSRIPKLQQLLKEFFNGRDLKKSINPDEAVAYGAALAAKMLSEGNSTDTSPQMQDVTPFSLGLQVVGGIYDICIPKNTTIPWKMTKQYATSKDKQTEVLISIYQGESLIAAHNHHLGEFVIRNIPKKRKGKVVFDITFEIDENGILHVYAKDKHSRYKGDLHICLEEHNLSLDMIAEIIRKANKLVFQT